MATLTLDLAIDDLLAQTPGVAEVFVRRGMLCVGCDISRFHTIREAAAIYGIDAAQLLDELREATCRSAPSQMNAPLPAE